MSATDSETAEREAFIEDDHHETRMTFDTGGVPFYLMIAWIALIAGYTIYMLVFALPDFQGWMAQ